MKNVNKFITVLLLLTSVSLFGQSSIYSRYGLGIASNGVSARTTALGGSTTALSETDHLGTSNPAGWSTLKLVRFEGGLSLTQMQQTDDNGSRNVFTTRFQGVRFGIPIQHDYGIVLAFFLEPLTFVDYSVQKNYTDADFGNYDLKYSGEGGLSKFGFGLTYRLPVGVSLGATFDYYTGSTNYKSEVIFNEFSGYKNSTLTKKFDQHGIGFTVGAISNNFAGIINSDAITDLRFGATYRYIPKVAIDTFLVVKSSVEEVTTAHDVVDSKIPYDLSFGMKLVLHKSTTLLSDFEFSPWSKFRMADILGTHFTDRTRFTLGLEYKDMRKKTKTFWERLSYRAGFSYKKMKYLVNNNQINEYAASVGLGVPINFDDILDLSLRFGQRGTADFGLVTEKFVSFGISLSFGEKWFFRRR